MGIPNPTEEQSEWGARMCEDFPILFPDTMMTPKMHILSCVLPKQIREQGLVHIMLKVEQEGERLNKQLNELEVGLVHIKDKPKKYFQLIRDYENKIFTDKSLFQTNKRKRKLNLSM